MFVQREIAEKQVNIGDDIYIWTQDSCVSRVLTVLGIAFYHENKEGRFIPVFAGGKSGIDRNNFGASVDVSPEKILEFSVKAEQACRDLTLFELSAIMKKLTRYYPAYSVEKWQRILSLYGDQWKKTEALADIENEWKIYFIEKNVPLRRMEFFFDKNIRESLNPFLRIHPSISRLQKAAVLLRDISRRERRSPVSIAEEIMAELSKLSGVLPALTGFIEKCQCLRYPIMTESIERLNKEMCQFHCPDSVSIVHDASFENPDIKLEARLRSREDVRKYIKWLNKYQENIVSLTEIINGEIDENK